MSAFQRATREKARLRLALCGPAGSGKTFTGLTVATHLGEKVAVIDTERGSASKYADRFAFDVAELDHYHPQRYIDLIRACDEAGYDVLVIDSLSHAWMGAGGALELVDQAAKRSRSSNSFAAWREVTPLHNALVDTILSCRAHVIVTMRSKTEYVLEDNGKGKKIPRKVGMAPVQRDGVEYEFDIVGDMDWEHVLVVSKTRCPALSGAVIEKPGGDFASIVVNWVSIGEAPRQRTVSVDDLRDLIRSVLRAGAWSTQQVGALLAEFGADRADELTEPERNAVEHTLKSQTGAEWATASAEP